MSDPNTTERPPSDATYWLYEYQKALINVRGLIKTGQSESAVKEIDEQIGRWRRACIAFPRWRRACIEFPDSARDIYG